ncbi:MAG TPA: BlaI/MecI/CopY family transcriptional regulator [Longimicrobiales bacterium]|nr:BlaI/MecI/CopY family transcriptional regulator [Longimicrobiales bacterium]
MDVRFTERELDLMSVLWDMGSATVAEVQERLTDDLAYTTVLTMLRTLEMKGHIAHREEGRAFRYYPLVDREVAGASALRRIMRKIFGGSPEMLLTQLVADNDLSDEELQRMRQLLDEKLGDGARS